MKCSEIRCTPYPHLLHFCSILHFCRSLAWARQNFSLWFFMHVNLPREKQTRCKWLRKCSRNRAKLKSACLSRFFEKVRACYQNKWKALAFHKIIFPFSDFTFDVRTFSPHTSRCKICSTPRKSSNLSPNVRMNAVWMTLIIWKTHHPRARRCLLPHLVQETL